VKPALVDSHAHLQEEQFDADREAVIAAARAAGVTLVVVPGVDLKTSEAGVILARSHPGVLATAGYHPHEASRYGAAEARALERLLAAGDAVAVGEIGLDYYRNYAPRADQLRVFEAMLDLAAETALPVVIHCRGAWEDTLPRLHDWSARLGGRVEPPLGVIHYFSADLALARRFVDLGFLISIHTSVTHPKSSALREVASELPLETLVLETDAPYGAPQSRRGQRNEPAFVAEAAALVAELRRLSLDEVAAATTANARRLFRVPAPISAAARGGVA
jgi:TatD DNase family protein